ncbi:MAG: membrane protein insertion efficiency factor YidD [Saprospiraceae bacterium]|nr:membrane protein insertion efficiency factor YidD [Saprospiraceae bacterium]
MKIIFTILSSLLAVNLPAQGSAASTGGKSLETDIILLQQAFTPAPKTRLAEQFSLSKENTNELQAVLSGLFLVYKSFFSSQDNQRCSFHPSCSEYGLEAVKKLGIVKGVICTCDRLTRCNGFSPEQYEKDIKMKRLKDPVSW